MEKYLSIVIKSLLNIKERDPAVSCSKLPSGHFSHLALYPDSILVILESYYISKENKHLEPPRAISYLLMHVQNEMNVSLCPRMRGE